MSQIADAWFFISGSSRVLISSPLKYLSRSAGGSSLSQAIGTYGLSSPPPCSVGCWAGSPSAGFVSAGLVSSGLGLVSAGSSFFFEQAAAAINAAKSSVFDIGWLSHDPAAYDDPVRLALLGFVAACGSTEDLTCELLADPTNCWADAAAKAAACLPARATPAVLSADRTRCTWDAGGQITFDTALPLDTFDLERLAFDATGPGCAWRFVDTFANRMELTVDGKTVVSQLHPDRTFELACPNGTSYEAEFDLLFTCQAPARAPTDGFEVTATSFTFTLSAVDAPIPLFTCMQ